MMLCTRSLICSAVVIIVVGVRALDSDAQGGRVGFSIGGFWFDIGRKAGFPKKYLY